MEQKQSEDWLARYASNYHAWKTEVLDGRWVYRRPLGLVEYSFDKDGTDFGGRADMNELFTLEVQHTLSKKELRRRIGLAWTSLRLQHIMLMSRVYQDKETGERHFIVDLHNSEDGVIEQTIRSIVWVDDYYTDVDAYELHHHCLNVGRIIEPSQCLSRLYVLPLIQLPNGNYELNFLTIMGHQISDGLTAYNWFSHFLRILNTPGPEIERDIANFMTKESLATRAPPAQEDLYPSVTGNKARERWFWAIVRVLRHVKKPLPPTFMNPIRREERLIEAISLEPKFSKLFDYSEEMRPPMSSGHCIASLSQTASTRLVELCRSIKVSVGAGCFALVGISMMEIEEQRHPNIPDSERQPFTASFPVNPRAFFGFTTPADSCMLAFSDGIVMSLLPSSLPIESRFKLIARQANRQLRIYQKRFKAAETNMSLETDFPARLLASGYLLQIERVEAKLPADRKTKLKPQGSLPASKSPFGATCGVSSMGSNAAFFKPGTYDFNDISTVPGKDFVADFRSIELGVRARDNEFLVGSSSDSNGILSFGVSYDLNAISSEAAAGWARKIEGLL
ncbi:hypothetical protein BDV95DRAFT_576925 [Massariosphaeria phaeospora]|uniref:Condensation domain-containing protein n=1 Tax=Massariosphaeria phaeospora TaxID=100035 RepID=A0A7C8M6P7_9PLEO|nr:hypothetical protein BDV95DRAFT_576925 [Massariosphaeria phaeospora]